MMLRIQNRYLYIFRAQLVVRVTINKLEQFRRRLLNSRIDKCVKHIIGFSGRMSKYRQIK